MKYIKADGSPSLARARVGSRQIINLNFSTGHSREAKSRTKLCFGTGMKSLRADGSSNLARARIGRRQISLFNLSGS